MKELKDYRMFTKPAELDKAVNTLRGIADGIMLDGKVSNDELMEITNWCTLHRDLIDRHPFSEIIPLIDKCVLDGELTKEEMLDILWVCDNIAKDSDYYNFITGTIQQLEGILQGALADNVLSDDEIFHLADWVNEHDFLKGTYPFDEIDSLLTSALSDGSISDDERNMLKAFFENFIDTTVSYNINFLELQDIKQKYCVEGICAVCPNIEFEDKLFSFTGTSEKTTRDEIAKLIISHGGLFNNSVIAKTNYLIVGNAGNPCWAVACYGRKVERAVDLRKKGGSIIIINESDFWDILE